MNGNYVLNIWGTYFQKICWCEYVLEMSYNRFLQGTFSVYANIFSMKHFGRHFKKNGNTMAPVRCCKNQIEFLWSIATRCLPEDVLLQIFGIIYIHARNMFEEYNCGYLQQVIEEYLRRLAKTCSEKLLSEVPPIWPGEKNIWETCPSYRFFRREMYSLFWVEI